MNNYFSPRLAVLGLHVILTFFCSDWQNYLRTQAGNTTTVNLVICTVDYLLRLQVNVLENTYKFY